MSDKPTIQNLIAASGISGALAGLVAGGAAALLHAPALAWGLMVAGIACLLSWWGLLSWWQRLHEGAQNIKPASEREPDRVYPLRVEVTQYNGHWVDYLDLPVTSDKMVSVCRLLANGGDFSHGGLSGPHRPLSRSEYEALRDEFIGRGLATWRNPHSHHQGVLLTHVGKAVARRIANNGKVTYTHKHTDEAATYASNQAD